MQHLLFILSDLAGGGAERVVVEILRNLDRTRFRPYLALAVREGPYLAELPQDVTVLDLGGARAFQRGQLWKLVGRLRRIVAGHSIDLLVSTTILPNAALARCRLLAPNLPPWILMQQDNLSAETRMRASGIKRRLLELELRILFRCATHIVCASQGLRTDLVKAFGLASGTFSVIRNGLPLARVRKQAKAEVTLPWTLRPHERVVMAIGRLVPQKGWPDLLQAFATVRPRVSARLIILGAGPQEAELKQRAQELGIADVVALVGFQENPWAWLARADLFVLASHHEGLGNVIVEAMACGVPVLSTDCPYGPGEIIIDGVTGGLVPVADPATLSARMLELLNDETRRRRLAQSAAARLEMFDSAYMTEGYERIFEEVFSRPPQLELTEVQA